MAQVRVENDVNTADNDAKNGDAKQCPLCGRGGANLTTSKHHLIPKSRQGKETVPICHDCHRQIHALFTERELATRLDTIEKLLSDPQMTAWLAWTARRPAGASVRVKTSKTKHSKRHQAKEIRENLWRNMTRT